MEFQKEPRSGKGKWDSLGKGNSVTAVIRDGDALGGTALGMRNIFEFTAVEKNGNLVFYRLCVTNAELRYMAEHIIEGHAEKAGR